MTLKKRASGDGWLIITALVNASGGNLVTLTTCMAQSIVLQDSERMDKKSGMMKPVVTLIMSSVSKHHDTESKSAKSSCLRVPQRKH